MATQAQSGTSFASKVFAILPLRGALLLVNLLASMLVARTLGPEACHGNVKEKLKMRIYELWKAAWVGISSPGR